MSEQPVVDSADLFYGTADNSELDEQTETEAVVVEAQADDQETEQEQEQPETEGSNVDESEESEESSGDDSTEDGQEELVYLELDGNEVDLEDVRKWRDGHMKDADYTQKTQAVAEDRKALTAEREEVAQTKAQLTDLGAELQALVAEDTAVNWDELREDDPDEYIKRKELADKRVAAVAKIKAESGPQAVSQDVRAAEQKALIKSHPSWVDDKGAITDAYRADIDTLTKYWESEGYTQQEIGGMFQAKQIETSLKAAKWDALQLKSEGIKSKAKKATLVTKPKQRAKVISKSKKMEDVFYGT